MMKNPAWFAGAVAHWVHVALRVIAAAAIFGAAIAASRLLGGFGL